MSVSASTLNTRHSAIKLRELPAALVLAALLAWLLVARPTFHSPENLTQVGYEVALLGILSCGEALVILTGGIDLSVGAMVAVAGCAAGARLAAGAPWPFAAVVGLAAGGAAGWLNGALITWRKLTPILTTLATLLIFRAGANIATGALPYNQLPDGFKALGRGWLPFALFVLLVAVMAIMTGRSRFGRRVVAVGGSEQAVRLSGVSTDAVLRRVYVVAGLCAGLTGLLMSAGSNAAQWNMADGWELEAIAAVVIGGVRLTGGDGSIVGAALGAAIVVVLRNALFLSGVPAEQYGLIVGGVIVLAALAEQFRRTREART